MSNYLAFSMSSSIVAWSVRRCFFANFLSNSLCRFERIIDEWISGLYGIVIVFLYNFEYFFAKTSFVLFFKTNPYRFLPISIVVYTSRTIPIRLRPSEIGVIIQSKLFNSAKFTSSLDFVFKLFRGQTTYILTRSHDFLNTVKTERLYAVTVINPSYIFDIATTTVASTICLFNSYQMFHAYSIAKSKYLVNTFIHNIGNTKSNIRGVK